MSLARSPGPGNAVGVGNRTAGLAAIVLLVAALAACAEDTPTELRGPPAGGSTSTSPTSSGTAEPQTTEPVDSGAGDLPAPLRLEDIDRARTVKAEPFADFAVAAGGGVWVSGVEPGLVRYDGTSGEITARVRVPGEMGQALAATRQEVLVPVTAPALALRVNARTGQVRSRVKLPANPLSEAAAGFDGATGYVLVDLLEPRIVAIEGERIVDEIPAPAGATAVRGGFGALWIPTSSNTVERYSLASGRWTTIAVGPEPRFLDVGFGAAWVMNQGDGSVTRIDAQSRAAERIPVTGTAIRGGDLTVGGGAVWLRTDSQVARIDPGTLRVTHVIDLPPGSASAAATDDLLVITNHDHEAVHLVPLPLPAG